MKRSFELKEHFPVSSEILYRAWLTGDEHGKMTGGDASCSDQVGADFTAWDEYISGRNIKLTRNEEITQSWRTAEFKESDENSELIIRFRDTENGCELTLIHNNIPPGQPDYKQGWIDNYFTPMKKYFIHG
jgi:activator of HSP90 ATPase